MIQQSIFPKVSLLVTCFNHQAYIKQCIDSLLSQTYKNIEIIVCDDCSTDNSYEILLGYGDRITLVRNDRNLGAINTLNILIKMATGDYIYRIDSDDYLKDSYIKNLVVAAVRTKKDLIIGNLQLVENDIEGQIWRYDNINHSPEFCIKHIWEHGTVPYPHNGLFRADFLQKKENEWEDFQDSWGCDVITTLKWSINGISVAYTDVNAFFWRMHTSNNTKNVENRLKLRISSIEHIVDNFSEYYYLDCSKLLKFRYNSDSYFNAKMMQIIDFVKMQKQNFRIPSYLNAEKNYSLERFDVLINKYEGMLK